MGRDLTNIRHKSEPLSVVRFLCTYTLSEYEHAEHLPESF